MHWRAGQSRPSSLLNDDAQLLFVQFAYLQLGTVLATLLRQVEVKLDQPMPEHNYHVGVPLVFVMTHTQIFSI